MSVAVSMNRLFSLLSIVLMLLGGSAASARNDLNASPESIIGDYLVDRAQMKGKVRITHESDGSFTGRVFYVENSIDPKTGKKMTDPKNPDKSLRDTPCDRILILWGLRYDDKRQCWTGGKIYDPTYGIRANATLSFEPDGRLKVTGSLIGISESVYWQKL